MTEKDPARALGCRCDECPLVEEAGPVLPERGGGHPTVLVLGDHPSQAEASNLRPFVGPAADLLVDALRDAGIPRRSTVMGMAIMCQPTEGRMKRVLARLGARNAAIKRQNTQIRNDNKKRAKANKKAAAAGEPQVPLAPQIPLLPTPMACCAPAVERLVAEAPSNIILAGNRAASAVMGGKQSVASIRGGAVPGRLLLHPSKGMRLFGADDPVREGNAPAEDGKILHRSVRIMPVLAPGFVHANKRWMETLRRDVDRMGRWMRTGLDWKDPAIQYHPAPHELAAFLSGPGPYTYDLETDGIQALSCNVRCVGIGDPSGKIVVVGVRSVATPLSAPPGPDGRFYPPTIMAQIIRVLTEFFTDPTKLKIGHNAGYYDKLVIRGWLGVDVTPTLDNVLLHRLAESELPHTLAYVASKYTDIPSWKATRAGRKVATEAETDHELHQYCGVDVAGTAACTVPLVEDVARAEQTSLIAIDHKVQAVCCDMHHVGMFVDQEARQVAENEMLAQTIDLRRRLQEVSGIPDLNPGSVHQIRRLLFVTWGLSPPLDDKLRFTDSGDPSTNDDVLRALYKVKLTEQQRTFLKLLRQYRGVMKELGTYVVKLRPMESVLPQIGWDDAAWGNEWEDGQDPDLLLSLQAEREKRGYEARGIVWADGRMRPGYNAHVTVMGRLSSSGGINAQNFPKHLRKLIIPQPGNVFVGADYDQLELRIAASRWNLEKYLMAFDAGWDPHTSVTAHAVFGAEFAAAAGSAFPWMTGTKFDGDANRMRQLSKIIQYAFQYKASVETGARIIHGTELADGSLPYARLSIRQVRQMRDAWMKGVPQLEAGWNAEIQHFRDHGFVEEPVHHRRRYFLDGENPNEIVNTPIQGAAAALVNDSMIALHEATPLHKWGPGTGLLTQTHDALMTECPAWAAPAVIGEMDEILNKRHPALPGTVFSAKAEQGMTWKEVA